MARNKQQVSEQFNSPFATALRELMKVRGKTQADIARVVSKTPQTVSQYVNGVSEPGYETLVKIADYFDVSLDYLLRKNGEPLKDPDIQSVHRYTGLSGASIKILHSLPVDSLEASFARRFFDDLLVEHGVVKAVTSFMKKFALARDHAQREHEFIIAYNRLSDSEKRDIVLTSQQKGALVRLNSENDSILLHEDGSFTISADEVAEMYLGCAICEAQGSIEQVIKEMSAQISNKPTLAPKSEARLALFHWDVYSDDSDEK